MGTPPATADEEMGTFAPEDLNPETRERIEAAVLEVFSATDFHRASIRDVAKKAGVSFTSIYKYYGSKEGLLFACLDHHLYALTERLIDHLQGIAHLKEKLRKVFWVQLDFYERNPDVGRILFLTVPYKKWMDDKTFKQPKFIDLLMDILRKGQQEGALNQGVSSGVLLDFIFGFIHRRFTMWIYRGQKENLTEDANAAFEMVWQGISNPFEGQHTASK
jgi:AcrR family transcriptional regulator